MCAAALAQVNIGKVVFGCHNDKFGGCGSILHLHTPQSINPSGSNHHPHKVVVVQGKDDPNKDNKTERENKDFCRIKDLLPYPIVSKVLEQPAIALLRSFYNRENFHAPQEKRKRKPPPSSSTSPSLQPTSPVIDNGGAAPITPVKEKQSMTENGGTTAEDDTGEE